MNFEQKIDKILENQKEILQKIDWLYIQCIKEENVDDVYNMQKKVQG